MVKHQMAYDALVPVHSYINQHKFYYQSYEYELFDAIGCITGKVIDSNNSQKSLIWSISGKNRHLTTAESTSTINKGKQTHFVYSNFYSIIRYLY